MKKYVLKQPPRKAADDLEAIMPTWRSDPASPRQLKLLRFFEVPVADITKGEANRHICRIFHTPSLIERWNKYKFITGDDDHDNPDLMPFDRAELDGFVLPVDWAEQLNAAARAKFLAQWKQEADPSDSDDDSAFEVVFQVGSPFPIEDENTEFLRELQFSEDDYREAGARLFLNRVLRPVEYAISAAFRNWPTLSTCDLKSLQSALVHWGYCPQLPRYGPHASWDVLNQGTIDPHRPLTKEERMAITDVAFQALSLEAFLSLESNGVKKHKDKLDLLLKSRNAS